MFPKMPDMRFAIPGRHTIRHPGLVPGPIQKGRDLKTTFAGRFLRSRIYAARFRDDTPFVFPDLFRDLTKRPRCKNNYLYVLSWN